jgi:hypothetical protein
MKTGDALLDGLTDRQRETLRKTLPSERDVMLGWALPLLERPAGERPSRVADQVEVLRGIRADPEAWCVKAIELAQIEGGHRAYGR